MAKDRASWRHLSLLGLPSFGLALSVTVVSTYLPVLLRSDAASNTVVGLIIGGEGVFSLLLPIFVGSMSDRIETRRGGRIPFILAAAPLGALALVFMPFGGSLLGTAALVSIFFAAYFTYYTPYRALYADVVPDELAGRAQSGQAFWRAVGFGTALIGGGLLIDVWQALPFFVAATGLLVGTAIFVRHIDPRPLVEKVRPRTEHGRGLSGTARRGARLLRSSRSLRAFLVANCLIELSLAALKTFIVLYLHDGLGYSLPTTSAIIAVVAVSTIGAALIIGKVGDHFGILRTMLAIVPVYGVVLALPLITHSKLLIPVLPIGALGGAVIMTLPYGLLMKLTNSRSHGAIAGLYSISRGIGVVVGPLITGVVIDLLHPVFHATQGYTAMWTVVAASMLCAYFFLRRIEPFEDRDPRTQKQDPVAVVAATLSDE